MRVPLPILLLSILCGGCGLHAPARQWKGLWRVELETSQFCPAPDSVVQCLDGGITAKKRIWLDFPSEVPAGAKGPRLGPGIYEIAFVGRPTILPGHYGHLGMYGEEIVGDRMMSMRKIEPRFSDEQIAVQHAADPGMRDDCLSIIKWGGPEALTKPQEECYKFDSPRRWKGLWLGAFETSSFCPEPARSCDTPGERIWLEVGPSAHLPYRRWNGDTSPVLYQVDFVGRKTAYPGWYGHVGRYQQEIIMDRLISIRRLPMPSG
jgi:hypothetical protein